MTGPRLPQQTILTAPNCQRSAERPRKMGSTLRPETTMGGDVLPIMIPALSRRCLKPREALVLPPNDRFMHPCCPFADTPLPIRGTHTAIASLKPYDAWSVQAKLACGRTVGLRFGGSRSRSTGGSDLRELASARGCLA